MPEPIIRADTVAAQKIEWLWRSHIPDGMLTLVAGRPGEGKSLFSAHLTAEISKRGQATIFSNMEDPIAHVVRPRLEAAGADLTKIHFTNFRLPNEMDELEKIVQTVQPRLLVMDPIAAHLHVSIYNDQEVRTVLSPLTAMATAYKFSVVAIHHTVKNTSHHHPLRAIGGSGGGLPGAARAVYVFGINPDDTDERALAPVKFNLGPMPSTCLFEMTDHEFIIGEGEDAEMLSTGRLLYLTDKSKVSATSVLMHGTPGMRGRKTPEKRERAAEFATLYLSMGPRPVEELREDAVQQGISWSTLRRAADEIGIVTLRRGNKKGAFNEWCLPHKHPALQIAACEDCYHDANDHLGGCSKSLCSCAMYKVVS